MGFFPMLKRITEEVFHSQGFKQRLMSLNCVVSLINKLVLKRILHWIEYWWNSIDWKISNKIIFLYFLSP